MRRINSITFVVSCLLIFLLTSCGNLVSKNTGAIVIALPGAEAARGYVPNDNDFANAQYNIVVVDITNSNRKVFQEKKNAGETLVVDIASGKYEVNVEAHVSNGYIMGRSRPVAVAVGETVVAEVSMGGFLPQYSMGTYENKVLFNLTRQPDDWTSSYDCYLIGDEGISIKPNLDRSDINAENWGGEWPFKITENSKFYLGGTFDNGQWHTNDDQNWYRMNALSEWVGLGSLDLPDLSTYNATDPNITIGNSGKIWWEIDQDVIDSISLQGEVWCKIGIMTVNGDRLDWVTGTHFTCGQKDSVEYKKLISDEGVLLEDLTLYEGMTASKARGMLKDKSWCVQCSLFYKPYGADSTWQIELPTRQSITTNYYD